MKLPTDILAEAAGTFIERSSKYGDAYRQFGNIMMALFPRGITLQTADEWNRYSLLHMEVAKLARYCNDFNHPHIDSQHDLCVYSSMLQSLDLEWIQKENDLKSKSKNEKQADVRIS